MTQSTSVQPMKIGIVLRTGEGSLEGKTPTFYEALERAIPGSAEEIAHQLQTFADIGVAHLIVALDPLTPATIEQFSHIVELVHQQ